MLICHPKLFLKKDVLEECVPAFFWLQLQHVVYLAGLAPTMFLVGSFGKPGAQTDQYVGWLREYCQAFFYGLSVKLLPAVSVAETGCSFRINNNSHNLQILTGKLGNFITHWNIFIVHLIHGELPSFPMEVWEDTLISNWTVYNSSKHLCTIPENLFDRIVCSLGDLLRFLSNTKPKDAFCIVGITMIDLYPKESWNFVFGQASLSMGKISTKKILFY